jgi:hypothetical protein
MVTSQSAALEHDTRLAVETLLERLPVGLELVDQRWPSVDSYNSVTE